MMGHKMLARAAQGWYFKAMDDPGRMTCSPSSLFSLSGLVLLRPVPASRARRHVPNLTGVTATTAQSLQR